MTRVSITFPKDLPSPLPKGMKDVRVESKIPPMSRRARAACGGALLVGGAAIALFAASIACHMGPGMAIFSGVSGVVLVGAGSAPPLCSFTESTARKIEIYEYLKDPKNQECIRKQIQMGQRVIQRRKRLNAMVVDPSLKREIPTKLSISLKGLKNVDLIVPYTKKKEPQATDSANKPKKREIRGRQNSITDQLVALLESRKQTVKRSLAHRLKALMNANKGV